MNQYQSLFRKRKVLVGRLEPFGFQRVGDGYLYKTILQDSGFALTVTIAATGEVDAAVMDPSCNEPYTLHLAEGATGRFVGGVRTDTERLLAEIAETCFVPDVFQSEQAKALIESVRARYGDELEFLWEQFPDNAVWRRRDTTKWYGALLTVSKRKLGLPSDAQVEILDLRLAPEKLEALIDHKTYFPGWHMNKKNWYTVILDGSLPLSELQQRLDESYLLATR